MRNLLTRYIMFKTPTQAEILLNELLNMRHLRNDDLNKLKKQQIELIITELEKNEMPPVASIIEINGNQNSAMPLPHDDNHSALPRLRSRSSRRELINISL